MEETSFERVSEEEFPELAEKIITFAGNESIWLFFGNLGAGKTTLIRHLCHTLGVAHEVQSPTFSIVNEYKIYEKTIYHFDCYRLKSFEEALDFGMEEYLDSGHLCFIEWPENIRELLPEKRMEVTLSHADKGRNVNVKRIR